MLVIYKQERVIKSVCVLREDRDTYVYVDKLLSYVDKTPYFSSLNLNMSLGSHPFD